jgi:hypothetical protein
MSFYPATLVAWATVSTSTRISALNGGNISLVVSPLVILTNHRYLSDLAVSSLSLPNISVGLLHRLDLFLNIRCHSSCIYGRNKRRDGHGTHDAIKATTTSTEE